MAEEMGEDAVFFLGFVWSDEFCAVVAVGTEHVGVCAGDFLGADGSHFIF